MKTLGLAGMKILVLGECMAEFRRKKEGLWQQAYAGDVFNTALYLKRLLPGVEVAFVSVTGQEPLSIGLRDYCQQQQLTTRWLASAEARHLGLYFICTDADGERSFIYYRDQSAARTLVQALSQRDWKDMAEFADWLFLSAISLAILSHHDRMQLLDYLNQMRQQGVKIAFDTNYRAQLWEDQQVAYEWICSAMRLSDLVFAGVEDMAAITMQTSMDAAAVADALAPLAIPQLVVKAGKDDVLVQQSAERQVFSVIPSSEVVDTTAAGDSFNSGYLAALLSGGDVAQRVANGCLLASTVIQYAGAIIPAEATPALCLRDAEAEQGTHNLL
jgi:2-dehydro-3-deoxygluconokinase